MRKRPGAAFCAGAFLIVFFAGYPVLPIQEGILSQLQCSRAKAAYTIRQNVRNTLENIERMEPGKIATHYNQRQTEVTSRFLE